jgi:hypothetical protein
MREATTGQQRRTKDQRNRFFIFVTRHRPPLRIVIPRAVSSVAIARMEVCATFRISASAGAKSTAFAAALAETAALSVAPHFPVRPRLAASYGFLSFTPRALPTASASFVLREIASHSA